MTPNLLDTFVMPCLALLEPASPPKSEPDNVASLRARDELVHGLGIEDSNQPEAEVVRADILAADGVHCLLVGPPGSGKTTLLRYLAYSKALNPDQFPIFVSLRDLEPDIGDLGNDLITLAFSKGVRQIDKLTAADVEQLRGHVLSAAALGNVVLFLDGLDEIERNTRERLCRLIEEFLSSSMSNNSLILSSRLDERIVARWRGITKYKILPFNLEQTRSLIEKHVSNPDMVVSLMNQLATVPALQALTRTPLLLVSLIKLAARTPNDSFLTANRSVWAQLVIDYMLQGVPQPRLARRILAELAYRIEFNVDSDLSYRHGFTIAELREVAREVAPEESLDELVTAVVDSQIVTRVGEKFEFAHRFIQEYLIASAITSRDPLDLIRSNVFDLRVSEQQTLPIVIGLQRRPDRAYRMLEALPDSIDFTILRLRARALRYADRLSQDHVERLVGELEQLVVTEELCPTGTLTRVAADLSGIIPEHAAVIVNRVAVCLQHTEAKVRKRAAVTLGAMRSPHAIDWLSRVLADSDREVQEEAANALGEIGDPSSVDLLTKAYLYGQSYWVFDAAVSALAKIGGSQAVSALVRILNEAVHRNLRWPVARALGEIGDPNGYEPLVNALTDKAESVRENAARALGLLKNSQAAPVLRPLLRDSETLVRAAAAEALGMLRDRESTDDLIQALNDSHPMVREAVADALAQIDRPRLALVLSEMIREPDTSWRGEAAKLLAKTTGNDALPVLLVLTRYSDSETRLGAAQGLMNITQGEQAPQAFLSLLEDPLSDVRRTAATGLGRWRYRPAVPALLHSLVTDDDVLVRINVATALGEIGDKQAVRPLIRMLDEGEGVVPHYSAHALGMIGDHEAIPALVAMCKRAGENDFMRDWPMRAIARIGGPAAAQNLAEMLHTTNSRGRVLLVDSLSTLEEPIAVCGLLLGLSDADPGVRTYAREGLRTISRATVETGLREGLSHTDPRVRQQSLGLIPFYARSADLGKLQTMTLTDPDPEVLVRAEEALRLCGRKFEPVSSWLDNAGDDSKSAVSRRSLSKRSKR